MHDWTKVPAGIFHAFHHGWISSLSDALNGGVLPEGYYALPEQVAAGRLTDVIALRTPSSDGPRERELSRSAPATAVATAPRTRFVVDAELDSYRLKKSSLVVRHVSNDDIIAMIEIVSPGNKASRHAIQTFAAKAWELIDLGIHLLVVDPFPPGPRDPQGIHAVIWEDTTSPPFELPTERSLTLVAYECRSPTRAYIEPIAVGQPIPPMPLFIEPDVHVEVPLESTYATAFSRLPGRWKKTLVG